MIDREEQLEELCMTLQRSLAEMVGIFEDRISGRPGSDDVAAMWDRARDALDRYRTTPGFPAETVDAEVMLRAVKRHANDNYENGWDTLVECYTDAEILRAIGDAQTIEQALINVNDVYDICSRAKLRAEIQAASGEPSDCIGLDNACTCDGCTELICNTLGCGVPSDV